MQTLPHAAETVTEIAAVKDGDSLLKFATLQGGRWEVEPGIEKRLQKWFDLEQADNVYVGASFDEPN